MSESKRGIMQEAGWDKQLAKEIYLVIKKSIMWSFDKAVSKEWVARKSPLLTGVGWEEKKYKWDTEALPGETLLVKERKEI